MFSHQQVGPSDSVGTVTSIKEPVDVAAFLETRGCSNITSTLNKEACSKTPWSGSGYGDIYRGALNDGAKVSIRTTRQYEHEIEELGASGYYKRLAKELHIWSKCKHPNVAELLGWVVFNESLAMVSKWMDQGNVTSYLQAHPTADRYSLSFSVCKGLAYLHDENIVHGNLKAANVLMSDDGIPVLTDFGNTRVNDANPGSAQMQGEPGYSPRWTAPEILQGTTSVTVAGDVYALGMTILEVFTGKVPYAEMSDASLYKHVVNDKALPLRPGEQISTGDVCEYRLWNLLTSCWSYDPEDRPNVHTVRAIAGDLVIAQIQGLTPEERLKRAADLNDRGNLARKDPGLAVDLYTQAIAMIPWPQATLYHNRAVCHLKFKPPHFQKAVEDCTQAILYSPKHVKAVNQRATTLEQMDDLMGALRDFTTLAIIEDFKNNTTSAAAQRVLYKLSTKQAEEIIRLKELRFPSTIRLSENFAAFRRRPNVVLPDGANTGDHKLLEAQKALSEFQYAKAYELVNAALDSGLSEHWKEGLAEALNLRGMFKFMMDDAVGANADFETSTRVWPDLARTWVLLARASMSLGKTEAAFMAFKNAVEKDPDCADIYHHRAQVFTRLSEFEKAAEDYRHSLQLDPTFVWSYIRLAVAQHEMKDLDASLSSFRSCLLHFPNRGEPYNYYGEALLNLQRFQDAIEKFDRAIEIERQKKILPNPLPFRNKALALYQWKKDLTPAIQLCKEALILDDQYGPAMVSLGQFYVRQGRLEEAVNVFSKYAGIASAREDMVEAFSYRNASQVLLGFHEKYPDKAEQLAAMLVPL